MASWLVEAYASPTTDVQEVERRTRAAAAQLTRQGRRVRCLRTILIRGDETCFQVVEAESLQTVRELADRAGVAAHRIVEAEP